MFITFKDEGRFKNRHVIFPKEFKRLEKYDLDGNWESDNTIYNYPSLKEIKRLRSGLWIFVYVKPMERETMDLNALKCTLKTIFGRYGIVFKTNWDEYYALIPRWGEPILYDKDGKKYDFKKAIELYAKHSSWESTWAFVNAKRAKHGKPPYPILDFKDCF